MSKLNKKLVKSIAKELGKYVLLSKAGLSDVAGGYDDISERNLGAAPLPSYHPIIKNSFPAPPATINYRSTENVYRK